MNSADRISTDPAGQAEQSRAGDGGGTIVAQWAAFVAAVQLLTRVPLRIAASPSARAFRTAPVYFPLVGALVGTFTAAAAGVGCLVWPVWLAVVAALACEVRLTGAFHEDGVADFCDAFGGGRNRDEVLTILKDSRIGTYGALGLFLAVALRASAMVAIIQQCGLADWINWGSAIVTSAAIGRWAIIAALARLDPVAGRSSLANEFGGRLSRQQVIAGGLIAAPPAILFAWHMPLQALAAAGLVFAPLWWCLRGIRRRVGGLTGDCLGFIGYISQVLVLLAAAARF